MTWGSASRRWRMALAIAGVAAASRLIWVLCVPTIVVGDFATYRESALYLSEHGRLDGGFIYMPGLVLLLAAVDRLGGDVLAAKMLGVVFGGIAAGALYLATSAFDVDGERDTIFESSYPGVVVAVLYLLWLPGLAMASVVGTDVPCASMICLALAGLFTLGPRRPTSAAIAFGAAMGIAAYFRAVALPLVIFSAGYWAALRVPARQIAGRTMLAVAVTLAVLSPWAIRNLRAEGRLSFTDTHGGITALMGNDPNTEGTYSRSLSLRFQALTGKKFLSRPHDETDRVAYQLAKEWIRFEPRWTLGMIALRIERLLAPERGLLYWSISRPGILPDTAAGTFNNHRPWITGYADGYGALLLVGLCAGIGFSVIERRWLVGVPALFALMLLATYALFVAEPRYRLTSEIVAFPTAAWGLSRLIAAAAGRWKARTWPRRKRGPGWRVATKGLVATGLAAVVLLAMAVGDVAGGRALRGRYRWASSATAIDGRAAETFWRTHDDAWRGSSMVQGTSDGVIIRAPVGGAHEETTVVDMMVRLPPRSTHKAGWPCRFSMGLQWSPSRDPARASLALLAPGSVVPFATANLGDDELAGTVDLERLTDQGHAGSIIALARLRAGAPPALRHGDAEVSVRISNVQLTSAPNVEDGLPAHN